jgi:L-ascorbate metabolism protein UlaG (beta-lactamase superfamily)
VKTTLQIMVGLSLAWLSGCRTPAPVAPAERPTVAAAGALEVTYLANEGFMIAGGGKKILIDALFRESDGNYAMPSPATRERMEQAREPFADVDAVFATHVHYDHFDAQAVLAHLTHNPEALFFSTPQVADALRATGQFDAIGARVVAALPPEGERVAGGHRGLGVQLLNLHHGRDQPTENLGVVIDIAGKRVLHIGDSMAEAAVFEKYGVAEDRIDVAFLPFWYLLEDELERAVREQIKPRHIVVMHVEQDTLLNRIRSGSWDKRWEKIQAEFPSAVVFTTELERKSFD